MKVDYEKVLKAIHAEESITARQRFKECTDPPYFALSHQDGLGVTKELVEVLEHDTKPKLLIFNGMNDMICNHIGNEKVLDNLKWKHTKEWTLAKRYVWEFESTFIDHSTHGPAGYMKEHDNLMFLKIASSGHMVPMDLPDVSLEMMRNLMYHVSFGSNYQKLGGILIQENGENCPTCQRCSSSETTDGNDDDDSEEADLSRMLLSKQFVSGGWFGTAIGVSMMLILNVWRSKRASSRHELVRTPKRNEESGYTDDPETEMVLSGTNRVLFNEVI